jgi:cobyrinic acid a,c-diamide synthase
MYLSREIGKDGATYPMAGVLDIVVEHERSPQGHGYVEAEVDRDNAFYPRGTRLKGHEFHYSRVVSGEGVSDTALRLDRGSGIADRRDGLSTGRVWASYTHVHALGTPGWAASLVGLADRHRGERGGTSAAWG